VFLLKFTVVLLVTLEATLPDVWDCTVTETHWPTTIGDGKEEKASFVGGLTLKVALIAGLLPVTV
jgi:hypothetical protein